MPSNRWRFDPYKAFNFRVLAAAAVAGATAFGVGKLLRRKKKESSAEQLSAIQIEVVGTAARPKPRETSRRSGKPKARD